MVATCFIRYIFGLLAVACSVLATDEAGTKYLEEKSKEEGVITLPSGKFVSPTFIDCPLAYRIY